MSLIGYIAAANIPLIIPPGASVHTRVDEVVSGLYVARADLPDGGLYAQGEIQGEDSITVADDAFRIGNEVGFGGGEALDAGAQVTIFKLDGTGGGAAIAGAVAAGELRRRTARMSATKRR